MSIPVIAFFNNKGGVGKTSLVYHLAWMYSDMGYRVIAADFDPQANLTAAFLDEERLEQLWEKEDSENTIYGSIKPLLDRAGDISEPYLEKVFEKQIGDIKDPQLELMDEDCRLGLIVGDLSLTESEDMLSENWPKCLEGDIGAFRVLSAFWRVIQKAAESHEAKLILMDLGPNLGAINRAALISSDYVVIPLSSDLFSLQGLRNLGPTLRRWRKAWQERKDRKKSDVKFSLPSGTIKPLGYVVMQHSLRLDKPLKYYNKWIGRMPEEYCRSVLDKEWKETNEDINKIALLKHFRSLMPMAQEARKPIFHLKAADGAIGAHYTAAKEAGVDFRNLAIEILIRANIIE